MRRISILGALSALCLLMTIALTSTSALARPAAPNGRSAASHRKHPTLKRNHKAVWHTRVLDTRKTLGASAVRYAVAAATSTVLLGDQSLESVQDTDQAGQAEAFPFVASASGTTSPPAYTSTPAIAHRRSRSPCTATHPGNPGH